MHGLIDVIVVGLSSQLLVDGARLESKLVLFLVFSDSKSLVEFDLEVVLLKQLVSHLFFHQGHLLSGRLDGLLDDGKHWIVVPEGVGQEVLAELLRDEALLAFLDFNQE